jgi:chlorite dismutase
MEHVLKYKLNHANPTTHLSLPRGATLLTAKYQGADLMLWALCHDTEQLEERKIRLVCTGEELHHKALVFISTVFTGAYVFHIFEDLG